MLSTVVLGIDLSVDAFIMKTSLDFNMAALVEDSTGIYIHFPDIFILIRLNKKLLIADLGIDHDYF